MQARLIPRHQVKGNSPENQTISVDEIRRCEEIGRSQFSFKIGRFSA